MLISIAVEIRDRRDRDRKQTLFAGSRGNFKCHYSMFKNK